MVRFGKVGMGAAAGALAAAALAAGILTGGAAQGADDFTDVPASHPQRAAILFAAERGWFQGYPDGTFQPDRAVPDHQLATVVRRAFPDGASRADLASFMRAGARALPDPPSAGAGCGWPVFSDVGETHPRHWDVKYATDYGWFQGYPDGTFRPDRTVTAAQTALVLRRAFPDGASRADLAAFMREGHRALDEINQAKAPYTGAEYLAYEIDSEQGGDVWDNLWVAGAGRSESRRLTDNVNDWRWSPDGRVLVYTVVTEDMYGREGEQVWVLDIESDQFRFLGEHTASKPLFNDLWWHGDIITYSPLVEFVNGGRSRSELWVYEGKDLKPRRLADDGWDFLPSRGEGDLKYATVIRDAAGEWAGAKFWSYDFHTGQTRRLASVSGLVAYEFSPGDKCAVYQTEVADQSSSTVGWNGSENEVVAVPALHIPGGYPPPADPVSFAPPLELTELWVTTLDGSPPRRLSDAPDYIDRYKWSPDGVRIAYQVEVADERGRRTGEVELWVVGADGSAPARKVADDVSDYSGYGWSPDGKHLAYRSPVYDENGDWLSAYDAWVVDAETFAQTRLFADGPGERRFHTGFSWRRDGQGIDFGVNIRDEAGYVTGSESWTADADGSNQRRTTPLFSAAKLKTAPDGASVAYVIEVRDGAGIWQSEELWTADADGSRKRRLADGLGDVHWLEWSPDGNNIAYETAVRDETGRWAGEELWVAAADGSALRRQVADEDIALLLWSRSGRWMAYTLSGEEGMWIAKTDGTSSRRVKDNPYGSWYWN